MSILKKIHKAIEDPELACLLVFRTIYNALFVSGKHPPILSLDLQEWNEIQARALKRTDLNEHLIPLFVEALAQKPKLIVELGTRGGDSTFVLERVAKLCQATLVSVDLIDCSGCSAYPQWIFVKSDDVEFARTFPAWCSQRLLSPGIDLLFIDTSHEYQHTVREINAWFPYLSENAKVIFHDTNLRRIYFRKDGSLDIGWRNQRGVIRAVEEYLGERFDENRDFYFIRKNWLIKHTALCSGLTVMEKWTNS